MATPFVNGPAHIWLRVGQNQSHVAANTQRTYLYLGTTESSPNIDIPPAHRPTHHDLAGERPIDQSYQGRTATISGDFTRWNENVLALAVRANPFSLDGTRGLDAMDDIGALMLTEGYCYSLIMAQPFAAKPVYQKAGLPAGFRFLACFLSDEGWTQGGTKPKKIRLVWHAYPILIGKPPVAQPTQQTPPPTSSSYSITLPPKITLPQQLIGVDTPTPAGAIPNGTPKAMGGNGVLDVVPSSPKLAVKGAAWPQGGATVPSGPTKGFQPPTYGGWLLYDTKLPNDLTID